MKILNKKEDYRNKKEKKRDYFNYVSKAMFKVSYDQHSFLKWMCV